MSLTWLRASLALWKRRLAYRKAQHAKYHKPGSYTPETRRKELATHWHAKEDEASRYVALRSRQIAEKSGPHIITAAQLGLTFQWVFGRVGTLTRTYGHYTGGPRARTRSELIATARAVHAQHVRQGWGGCSYGPMIGDDGTLVLMNPIDRKAAGVAGHNTGSVHLNVPGTTGHRMTPAAEETLRWYVANAHTRRVPKAYRSPVDLRKLNGRVHRDDNATACPGDYTPSYRKIL